MTTPIYVAAEHSHIDVLRALLRRQRSASPPPPAHAPLLIALVTGQHAAAHALLDVGVDVDAPLTPSDRLPVYVAAEFGRAKPLERLLKQGASPIKGGREDFVGASPLYVAARNGHGGIASPRRARQGLGRPSHRERGATPRGRVVAPRELVAADDTSRVRDAFTRATRRFGIRPRLVDVNRNHH